jgi:hypothetical protein
MRSSQAGFKEKIVPVVDLDGDKASVCSKQAISIRSGSQPYGATNPMQFSQTMEFNNGNDIYPNTMPYSMNFSLGQSSIIQTQGIGRAIPTSAYLSGSRR